MTDADLLLGLLDAENFLGGDMQLDMPAAEAAMARLGAQLGTDRTATARGIYRIVAETMAAAARTHATDRGVDYRGLPLLAFGGAGPVHACAVGELLQSAQVIFPPQASVLSAFGTLVTPIRLDLVRSAVGRLEALDWDDVDRVLEAMIAEGRAALDEAGTGAADTTLQFAADLRYFGQQNEVTVEFADPRPARDWRAIHAVFEAAYHAQYGVNPSHVPVEIVSWRLTARGRDVAVAAVAQPAPRAPGGPRSRWIGVWESDTPVLQRDALAAGAQVAGPVIIEERETTIVIPPGWHAVLNDAGCIVATPES